MLHVLVCVQAYNCEAILSLYVSFVNQSDLWMVMPYMEVRATQASYGTQTELYAMLTDLPCVVQAAATIGERRTSCGMFTNLLALISKVVSLGLVDTL